MKRPIFQAGIILMAALGLSCNLTAGNPGPKNPTTFVPEDCNFGEVDFLNPTVAFYTDGDNAGPYLICSLIEQGTHDSVTYYISIIAYKADKLDQYYIDLKASNESFVDQAVKWNSNP